MTVPRRLALVALVTLTVTMAACSEYVAKPEVAVRLGDYSMSVSPGQADEGVVKIFLDNDGAQPHELVLVRGDEVKDLPLLPDGSVDVAKLQVADRLKAVRPGQYRIEPELFPGPLVLFCNLVTKGADGQPVSHFQQGMSGRLDIRLTTSATTRSVP